MKRIQDFYRYLAVCHEVVAEKLDDGKIKLSAPNPDDEALVCAAAYFGYEFLDRREGKYITIFESAKNRTIEVEVLNVIAFSSDRKRMSVVIRDIDRKIKIITKGADSAMFPRMHRGDEELLKITARDIDRFSMEGLRCLVVAAAEIEEEKYEMWNHHYRAAIANIVQIDKRKNNEQNDIDILEDFIEKGLHVIGATAIEDRLQDGVPECIEKLAMAGIKVWVLTGDKEETAINIAVACNLVQPQQYMEQIIINRKIAPDVHKAVEILKKELEVRTYSPVLVSC